MPVTLRSAVRADDATIKKIVRAANINPMDLNWQRFIVAEEDGQIIGTGQIKPHNDGSRELASIAVVPERQGQEIGSRIIRALIERESGVLYLMCREKLGTYYPRFGFYAVADGQMPPYFRRIARAARIFSKIMGVKLLVMKRDPAEKTA